MKKRVLVIDDDEDILAIFNIISEEEGYEFVLFDRELTTGEIQVIHPDLILLDVRLRGSSRTGDQICKGIKSIDALKNLPVLLVSAEMNIEILAKNSGADGYIGKPFDIDDMINKVNEFLV